MFFNIENRKDITGDFYKYDKACIIYVLCKKVIKRCYGHVVRPIYSKPIWGILGDSSPDIIGFLDV